MAGTTAATTSFDGEESDDDARPLSRRVTCYMRPLQGPGLPRARVAPRGRSVRVGAMSRFHSRL